MNPPNRWDVEGIAGRVAHAREASQLNLLGRKQIAFSYRDDLVMHRTESLPFHANGMRFSAYDAAGEVLDSRVFYSVGGGFIVDETASEGDVIVDDPTRLPHPFTSGKELLARCSETGLSISALMLENEQAWRDEAEIPRGPVGTVASDGRLYRSRLPHRGHYAGRPQGKAQGGPPQAPAEKRHRFLWATPRSTPWTGSRCTHWR